MPQTLQSAIGSLILAGSLALGGCSGLGALSPVTTAGHATLVLNPRVLGAASRRPQAVVPRLTVDDVDHVRIQLMRGVPDGEAVREAAEPVVLRVQKSDLDRSVILSQLRPHTRYQVRALAYKAPDEAAESLISTETSVEVAVGDDDRPTVSALPIQLTDVPFNGKAAFPFLDIMPGGYRPDGTESVQVETRPFTFYDAAPEFTWLGLDGDRLSRSTRDPDGLPDAHIRLSFTMPEQCKILAMILTDDTTGHYWSTARELEPKPLLGVAQDGQFVTSGPALHLGTYSGAVTFDLYAQGESEFEPGKSYSLYAFLSNYSMLRGSLTIPVQ